MVAHGCAAKRSGGAIPGKTRAAPEIDINALSKACREVEIKKHFHQSEIRKKYDVSDHFEVGRSLKYLFVGFSLEDTGWA